MSFMITTLYSSRNGALNITKLNLLKLLKLGIIYDMFDDLIAETIAVLTLGHYHWPL